MEILLLLTASIVVIFAASIPAMRYEKKTGKKLGRGAAAAGFQVINGLFQPSAANAAQIIEEQREAVKAKPSPEDKGLDEMISNYISSKKQE